MYSIHQWLHMHFCINMSSVRSIHVCALYISLLSNVTKYIFHSFTLQTRTDAKSLMPRSHIQELDDKFCRMAPN